MNVPTDRGEPERAGWLGTGPVPDTEARKSSAARGRSEEGWEGLCAQPPRGPCFLHYSPVGVHLPRACGCNAPREGAGPRSGSSHRRADDECRGIPQTGPRFQPWLPCSLAVCQWTRTGLLSLLF